MIPMALTTHELLEAFDKMTILELSEFAKAFQERYGVTAAAPVAATSAPTPAAAAAPEVVAEPTEFNVVLTAAGPNKINVIKAVHELTNLGLKEARDAVAHPPTTIKEAVSEEEAEAARAKLADADASVEVLRLFPGGTIVVVNELLSAPQTATRPTMQEQYGTLRLLLKNKNWQAADEECKAIIRRVVGGPCIDNARKAYAIPDEVLRMLHNLWMHADGGPLAQRPWIGFTPDFNGFVAWYSLETWLGKRLKDVGLK
jgi:large subunit ribosomal protein L7/L12